MAVPTSGAVVLLMASIHEAETSMADVGSCSDEERVPARHVLIHASDKEKLMKESDRVRIS
ncbi:hypothetical protein NKI38_32825 [Mesorhizobium sp. M0621]|uniref:hypothetical protein n=1 Tax=Mesorhizobium sp. M0621 TaxID=2956974 RepID=UPI0033359B1B